MTKLPFNAKSDLFRWGPIPGWFLYASVFTEVNYKYFCQKYLGENWSESLFLFKDGRMVWVNDYAELRKAGTKVFIRNMLPAASREKIYKEWKKYVRQLDKMEKEAVWNRLDKLDNVRLLKLWKKFHGIYLNFWITGTVPELGNYGADKYLEDGLGKYMEKNKVAEAMEILCAPIKPSFYQKEEMDLAEAADIAKHRRKYFWLKNSYGGSQTLTPGFFSKRKEEIDKDITKEIDKKLKQTKKLKLEIGKKYKLPGVIMNIAAAISDGIAWQDERKSHIFKAIYYEDKVLEEATKRFGYAKNDLLNAWYYEIADILGGKDMHQDLAARREGFGVQFYKTCRNLSPKEVQYFLKVYTEASIKKKVNEIRGVVASRGKGNVTGKVRILLDPYNLVSFRDGEILVAPMTSPEYIFVMKKAAAIVTDAGGLTSHAAIVSRELGIPCVVGTKIATQVLKNGDVVEINAAKGLVKII